MAIAKYITNQSEVAYERLPQQFKDKPIIHATVDTWAGVLQDITDDIHGLIDETLFLVAEGKNIERYGNLFNLRRPAGMTDDKYRELLIGEILRRSSDGTPDRIRQILEGTLGLRKTKIFEHINELQLPTIMGCVMVYGLSDTLTLKGSTEARYLRAGSPITTGSTVLGCHSGSPLNLHIPAEIVGQLDILVTHDKDFIVDNVDDKIGIRGSTFSEYGSDYEYGILPELGVLTTQLDVQTRTETDAFVVETNQGVEEDFYVQYFNVANPTVQHDHGVMLEISQLNINED